MKSLPIYAITAACIDLLWVWYFIRPRTNGRFRAWRMLCAAFGMMQLTGNLLIICAPGLLLASNSGFPTVILATLDIWHFGFVPFVIVPILTLMGLIWLKRRGDKFLAKFRDENDVPWIVPQAPAAGAATRRQFLQTSLASIPIVAAPSLAASAIPQHGQFNIRQVTLKIPQLPAVFEGLRIAHVSDLHVGKLFKPSMLDSVVHAVNELDVDLVLMTGDLIDYSLEDLPAALKAVQRMRSRMGLAMCPGNHDLSDDADEFRKQVQAANVTLLDGQSKFITITRDGAREQLQILGLPWCRHDWEILQYMNALMRLRDDSLFTILLAHHPHAFDVAVTFDIPLTLCGHTHGGQMMLSEKIGCGPLLFRYWSGAYQKRESHLVVSNGVGSWFPLRINAPAEIGHITLRRGDDKLQP